MSHAPEENPDIPALRPRREKERKGVGVPIPIGAGPSASSMGWGKMLAAVFFASGALGAGVVIFGVPKLPQKSAESSSAAVPELEPVDSLVSTRMRDPKASRSLAFTQRANSGQLNWESGEGRDGASTGGESGGAEGGFRAQGRSQEDYASEDAPEGLAHDLSGAKLSQEIGGAKSSFNGRDIFAQNKFNLKGGRGVGKGFQNKLSDSRSSSSGLNARRDRRGAITSDKTLRQLRVADARSREARSFGAEGGAAYAESAFGQTARRGDAALAPASPGSYSSDSQASLLGGGAPDLTESSDESHGFGARAPEVGESSNQTPYQDLVDRSQQMSETSLILMGSGAAILAAGTVYPPLLAVGGAMVGAGIMLEVQANDAAEQLRTQYGQDAQADILQGGGASVNLSNTGAQIQSDIGADGL